MGSQTLLTPAVFQPQETICSDATFSPSIHRSEAWQMIPSKMQPQDAQRVNVTQDHELRYWSQNSAFRLRN